MLAEGHDTHTAVHPKYVMGGDITGREVLTLAPLALAVIVLGVFPGPVLKAIQRPLDQIRDLSAERMQSPRQRPGGNEGGERDRQNPPITHRVPR